MPREPLVWYTSNPSEVEGVCIQLHVLRMTLGKIPVALKLGPHGLGGSLNTIVHSFCILWYFRAVGRCQAAQLLGWKILAAPS